MEKKVNRKVVGIISAVVFGVIALCLVLAFSLNKARIEAVADGNPDTDPTVSVQLVKGAEEYVEIKITSHNNQVLHPQIFNKDELMIAFDVINHERFRYRDLFDMIQNGKNVHLVIDKYADVAAMTINNNNLKVAFDSIHDGSKDDSKDPVQKLIDYDKVVVSQIDFTRANMKDVTFDGEEVVSNIPSCKKITIESPVFANNCITCLPKLEFVKINNRSTGYEVGDLNKAMSLLGDQVICDVHRNVGSDLKYEFIANADTQDHTNGKPGEWSSIKQNIDENPEEVTFDSKTGQMTIKSRKNSNDFGYLTLQAAFNKIEQGNSTNSAFWQDVSNLENVSLRIEVYGGYTRNAISQAGINQALGKWVSHVDKLKNNPLKLTSIDLICANSCQIYFRGPHVIHNCPFLTSVSVERANFPKPIEGVSPSIYNCPVLSNVRINNRAESWPASSFNIWIQKVAPGCHVFIHRNPFISDVHYDYSYNRESKTGNWIKRK